MGMDRIGTLARVFMMAVTTSVFAFITTVGAVEIAVFLQRPITRAIHRNMSVVLMPATATGHKVIVIVMRVIMVVIHEEVRVKHYIYPLTLVLKSSHEKLILAK